MRKIVPVLLIIVLLIIFLPLPKPKKQVTPAFNVDDLKFPKGFFWGASTSAHQVEGNTNNQLTEWEKNNAQRLATEAEAKLKDQVPDWDAIKTQATDPQNYISGRADDEYNLYPTDIQIMKQLDLNSYRFSIEWSRIEPTKGQFNVKELQHYAKEIKALKAAGLEPFVTLWHRSQPKWVLEQGDWENPQTINDFIIYVEYLAKNLGPDVKYWMTFNEPTLNVVAGYVQGTLPPEVKSLKRSKVVLANMAAAHNGAYKVLHSNDSDAVVGSTHAMQIGSGAPNTVANQFLANYLDSYANWNFLDATKDNLDFVGIQYYGPTLYALKFGIKPIVSVKNFSDPKALVRSDTGVEVYPAGINELINQTYKRYKKPIIITENGIADMDDNLRADYLAQHLYWVQKAINDGVPVLGYFHWSLLDNFEWDSGYWPRFGLIEVDRQTLQRQIRPSAFEYKRIIDNTLK